APPGAAWELAEIAGDLWIGTWSHGLWRYRDDRFEALDLLPGSHGAWAVEEDGRSGLWVGTDDGLFHLADDGDVTRLGAEHGLSRSFIQALRRDQDGNLWIGTNGGGLHRLTFDGLRPIEARIQRIERNRGALGRQIWELFEDREGHLWVGTFGGGLERFGEASITTVGPGDGAYRQVNAVLAEPDGCVWLATHTDGVWHQCGDRPTTMLTEADGLPTAGAWTLARDHGGMLWIGTARGLVTVREGELQTVSVEQGLPNAVVLALHPAQAGGVWVGTNGGLARVDGDHVEVVDPDRLPSPLIRGIDEERDGTLWVGTSGAGLVRLAAPDSDEADRVYGTADGMPGMLVWSLFRDRQDVLWIGSSGGLSRFVDGTLRTLDSRHGLSPDSVSSILEDASGGFWLATPAGIVHLERPSRDAYFLDQASSVAIEHYGSAEGMGSTEFLGGVQPSSARSTDGRLWFPSLAGAAVLDPTTLRRPDTRVIPIIEELRVDGALRPTLGSEQALAAGVRRIELRFTAPTIHAAYRLH
ncbi:MAG: two-component regulator propeller domain-containing protein, partial [Acidobacteriota bacterium]